MSKGKKLTIEELKELKDGTEVHIEVIKPFWIKDGGYTIENPSFKYHDHVAAKDCTLIYFTGSAVREGAVEFYEYVEMPKHLIGVALSESEYKKMDGVKVWVEAKGSVKAEVYTVDVKKNRLVNELGFYWTFGVGVPTVREYFEIGDIVTGRLSHQWLNNYTAEIVDFNEFGAQLKEISGDGRMATSSRWLAKEMKKVVTPVRTYFKVRAYGYHNFKKHEVNKGDIIDVFEALGYDGVPYYYTCEEQLEERCGWGKIGFEIVANKPTYKIGDKVVPHSKTAKGFEVADITEEGNWHDALADGQPFLYVNGFEHDNNNEEVLQLGTTSRRGYGNFYRKSDVTPYVEPKVEEPVFSVGDVVECIKPNYTVDKGMRGSVVHIHNNILCVQWINPIDGHDCNGHAKLGTGWNVSKADVKKVENLFKVGDLLTANEKNDYSVTDKDSLCRVVSVVSKGRIKVKVEKHKDGLWVGNEYEVREEYFKLATESDVKKFEPKPTPKPTFKIGDYVECTDSYFIVDKGMRGRVVGLGSETVRVEWADLTTGHSCGGDARDGHGYNLPMRDVKKVDGIFKVGDILAANEINHYGVTNKNGLYEVVSVLSGGEIKVKVVKHKYSYEIGGTYYVSSKHFGKATKEDIAKFELKPAEELKQLEDSLFGNFMYAVSESKRAVVVAIVKNGKVQLGTSDCEPDDKFDETIGKLIALKRALGIKFDASVYGEPLVKDCSNCKHKEVFVFDKPCQDCSCASKWEDAR